MSRAEAEDVKKGMEWETMPCYQHSLGFRYLLEST